jgi:radical SAM protein with 4Fe4S-binding SPASM domain
MWRFDVRPLFRRLYPADAVTHLLCQNPIPLSFDLIRLVARAIRSSVADEIIGPRLSPKRPSAAAIEITNACNLRCTMCNLIRMERAPRLMQYRVFKVAVDKCREAGIRSLRLHSYGETLLHPQLGRMIRYAVDSGLEVWISTNGQLLDETRGREILEAGVSYVRYSVEGATAATYEKVRARGSWDTLICNMKRFRELRDELRPATRIGLNTVLMKETLEDVHSIVPVFAGYVDEIAINPLEMLGTHGEELSRPSLLETDLDHRSRTPCRLPWELLNITVDGKVSLCCADVEASHIIGDVLNQSVTEIWTGPEIADVRRKHRARRFDEVALCRRCSFGATNTNKNRLRYSLLGTRQVRFKLR